MPGVQVVHHTLGHGGDLNFELECYRQVSSSWVPTRVAVWGGRVTSGVCRSRACAMPAACALALPRLPAGLTAHPPTPPAVPAAALQVTCYQCVLRDAESAYDQINRAILAACEHRKPVYISVPANLATLAHPAFAQEPAPLVIPPPVSAAGARLCVPGPGRQACTHRGCSLALAVPGAARSVSASWASSHLCRQPRPGRPPACSQPGDRRLAGRRIPEQGTLGWVALPAARMPAVCCTGGATAEPSHRREWHAAAAAAAR